MIEVGVCPVKIVAYERNRPWKLKGDGLLYAVGFTGSAAAYIAPAMPMYKPEVVDKSLVSFGHTLYWIQGRTIACTHMYLHAE